ncbi:PREDICTED: UDP-glucuronosyltransferase 2B13-like [Cyprinodon variegatus]|uniref:UDP-glucuronosyltransferase 2B13-like n=1 Tax=Cyprinodon variegatus TaxID=28743 RepID=UPI00074290A9|nr:PREDICTED: UDP-glucuronosyltransferase 2B13-like [Cyprinodon variegatus]
MYPEHHQVVLGTSAVLRVTFVDLQSTEKQILTICPLLTLAVLLCSSSPVSGGKVLVFPVDGSHWVNMNIIIKELHIRGHEVTKLSEAEFALVLTDPAFGGGVFLGHRLGLPLVFNVRWAIQSEGHNVIAPSPLSYIPIPGSELTDKMTFKQRVKNFLIYVITCIQFWYIIEPNYKPFAHRYFGKDVNYMELFQAADVWLMRNDFTFEFPRPTTPNIVYMSGFQ